MGVGRGAHTYGESPRGIDEAVRIGIEATGDGVHAAQLTKGVDDVEHHDPHGSVSATARPGSEDVDQDAWEPMVAYPMIRKSTRSEPGPPVLKALPEPTKKPAPMEPPIAIICRCRGFMDRSSSTIP